MLHGVLILCLTAPTHKEDIAICHTHTHPLVHPAVASLKNATKTVSIW